MYNESSSRKRKRFRNDKDDDEDIYEDIYEDYSDEDEDFFQKTTLCFLNQQLKSQNGVPKTSTVMVYLIRYGWECLKIS
jgi:hypothetical protein